MDPNALGAPADDVGAIALGADARATREESMAIGSLSEALGVRPMALGSEASAVLRATALAIRHRLAVGSRWRLVFGQMHLLRIQWQLGAGAVASGANNIGPTPPSRILPGSHLAMKKPCLRGSMRSSGMGQLGPGFTHSLSHAADRTDFCVEGAPVIILVDMRPDRLDLFNMH